jgi:hypothetical protein
MPDEIYDKLYPVKTCSDNCHCTEHADTGAEIAQETTTAKKISTKKTQTKVSEEPSKTVDGL